MQSSAPLRLATAALFAAALLTGVAGTAARATTAAEPAPAPQETCKVSASDPIATAAVRVADSAGALIPNAFVEIYCGDALHTGLTDAQGELKISLRPGFYHVVAQAQGFAKSEQTAALPAASGPLAIALQVGSAGDVVNVSTDTDIVAYSSNFGSKTGTALAELPQTVNVITGQEINLRNAQTVNEILRYTPGVETDQYGVELRYDWIQVRGFTSDQFGVFRDGMRWNSLAGKVDPYELESVEVIKGPSSVLYGQAPPGGLINLTTKRPSAERRGTVEGQFGSYDRRQGQFDFTGSFDSRNIFQYRLLGLIRNSNTQVNYTPDDRRLLAPELEWRPSDRTSFTLLGDWQHDKAKWSQFLPADGTLYTNPNGPIPVDTFTGEPGKEGVFRDSASIGYLADHHFNDGWEIHQNYRYQYVNFQGSTIYGTGFEPGSFTMLTRYAFSYPQYTYIHTLDTRAMRRVTTSNWEHTLLAGFDFSDMAQRTTGSTAQVADINVYHPVYGATIPALSAYENNFEDTPQYGVYLQDQLKFKRRLVLTLGGREDWAVDSLTDFLYGANQHQNNSKFTGRAGVTYLTDLGINPYYSFSTSFQPTTGTDYFGNLFKPTYGEQNEAGLKFQPRNWNSFLTASLFNIDQSNVLTTDPDPTHPYSSIQGGSVRSRGVELEAVSQFRGASIHAGYSLVATSYTKASAADAAELGKWFPQVPRNQFSFLADYTVPSGPLAKLGGNFGVRYIGLSYGDSDNTLAIPDFTLLDAALRYSFRKTEWSVNATNLTDKTYVATCTGISYCGYGFKRDVIGNVKYHF